MRMMVVVRVIVVITVIGRNLGFVGGYTCDVEVYDSIIGGMNMSMGIVFIVTLLVLFLFLFGSSGRTLRRPHTLHHRHSRPHNPHTLPTHGPTKKSEGLSKEETVWLPRVDGTLRTLLRTLLLDVSLRIHPRRHCHHHHHHHHGLHPHPSEKA
jgi:uncharacterized membrane protein